MQRRIGILLILLLLAGLVPTPTRVAAVGTVYYVDCLAGRDTASGTSPSEAWRTLTKVNSAKLVAGDRLLFKRGCRWTGPLEASWTGTAEAPIRLGAYGTGARPRIENAPSANIRITGAYQVIQGLETWHDGAVYARTAEGYLIGWKLGITAQSGAHHNTIRNLLIHGHAIGVYLHASTRDNQLLSNTIIDQVAYPNTSLDATGVLLHGHRNEVAYNEFRRNAVLGVPFDSITIELYNATASNIHHNRSNDRVFIEMGSGSVVSADNRIADNTHATAFEPAVGQNGSRFVITRGAGCPYGPVWRTTVEGNTVKLTGSDSQGVVSSCSTTEVTTIRGNTLVAKRKAWYIGGSAVEHNNRVWPAAGLPVPSQFFHGQPPHPTTVIEDPGLPEPAVMVPD